MSKLPHPYKWYYKSIFIDGVCPICGSTDLATSKDNEIVYCSGYGNGGYTTLNRCNMYAEEAQQEERTHCLYCSSADFVNRKIVDEKVELVAICENCDDVFNITKLEKLKAIF